MFSDLGKLKLLKSGRGEYYVSILFISHIN